MRLRPAWLALVLPLVGCFEDLGPDESGDEVGETGTTTGDGDGDGDGESSDSSGESSSESSTDTSTATSDDEAEQGTSDTGMMVEGVYEPCGPNGECPGGGTCQQLDVGWFVFGMCKPTGCDLPSSCPPGPAGNVECIDGLCTIPCVDDASLCGPAMVCLEGQCWFNVLWGPCPGVGGQSCPPNSVCSSEGSASSACTPQCNGADECQSFGVPADVDCIDGVCEILCFGGGTCPDGMECNGDYCRTPNP